MSPVEMRKERRIDFGCLAVLLGCLIIFYPDLFLARSASLMGDHMEQHYPWAFLLAESIKKFEWPWWTHQNHCGFPIAAEGQIGAFYPPNLILCFLLPIQWAYSYMNVLHFLIAGWATYLYARSMRFSTLAALVASFVFLFGSSYGGAYYNITSLKTICWFPVSLFFFEQFYHSGKFKYLVFLSLSNALMILAGYLQVATLTQLIVFIYVLFRIFAFWNDEVHPGSQKFKRFLYVLTALAGSVWLAFPQLFMTFRLALFSNRLNLSESYAYVGSLSPIALLTLILIEFQGFLRGNSLYLGLFPVFLILSAMSSKAIREKIAFKIWTWVGLISLFLALGKWSPVYVMIIKLTHFYSFRVPAKFLVFVCFALAMLAGLGAQAIQNATSLKTHEFSLRRVALLYSAIIFVAVVCHGFFYFFVTVGRSMSDQAGQWFLREFLYGTMGHPHSLEVYYMKLEASLDSILALLSFKNPWNLWNYLLMGLSLIFMICIWQIRHVRQKQWWLCGGLLFLFVDLYGFSWRDMRRDFNTYESLDQASPVIEQLKEEQREGRLSRVYGMRTPDELLPVVPSANMLYHFEDIGAYSPFVIGRYHETVGQFGNINDSNMSHTPSIQWIKDHFNLLNLLDVSHILSKQRIDDSDVHLLLYDPETTTYLYRNENEHVRAFFVSRIETFPGWEALKSRLLQVNFDPFNALLLERSELQKLDADYDEASGKSKAILRRLKQNAHSELWSLEAQGSGFFVLSNTHYPGWSASIEGKEVPILKAYGLFQTVWIPRPGRYEILFRFNPFHVTL